MDFIDTNVFLYALSDEPSEQDNRDVARAIVDGGGVATSVQVLQEFYVQATRPSRPRPIVSSIAMGFIEAW
jgi:predicted nucleic acid-binding protein